MRVEFINNSFHHESKMVIEQHVKLIPGKNNKEERLNFVRYWAEYIKNNPNSDWSKQQAKLINSQLKNRGFLKKEDYLHFKRSNGKAIIPPS